MFVGIRYDIAALLMRLLVGGLMLPHGVAKIFGGVGHISDMLGNAGMPRALAYGVFIGEILAPLMLIFGVFVGIGGLIIAANMIFAIGLAHAPDLFRLAEHGGWAVELQMFFLVGAIVCAILGAGRMSLWAVMVEMHRRRRTRYVHPEPPVI